MQPANASATIEAPADKFLHQFLADTLMLPPCCREKCDGGEMSKLRAIELRRAKLRAIPTSGIARTAARERNARALAHGVAHPHARDLPRLPLWEVLAQLEYKGEARARAMGFAGTDRDWRDPEAEHAHTPVAHEDFGLTL